MYVSVHSYLCGCVHLCVYHVCVCVRARMFVSIHMCECVCVFMCMLVCIHMCVDVLI